VKSKNNVLTVNIDIVTFEIYYLLRLFHVKVVFMYIVVKDMTKPFTSLFDASMFWYVLHKGIKVQPNFCLKAQEYNPSLCIFALKVHEYNPSIYISAYRHMSTTLPSIFLP